MTTWQDRILNFIRDSPTPYIGERTIAAALGTNRRVVRDALAALEQEGKIQRTITTGLNGATGVSRFTILENTTP